MSEGEGSNLRNALVVVIILAEAVRGAFRRAWRAVWPE